MKKWSEYKVTKEQAICFHDSGVWKEWTLEQVVRFQLFQDTVCIDWRFFCQCVNEVFGRGVYTHEYANDVDLRNEYLLKEGREEPTFEEMSILLLSN